MPGNVNIYQGSEQSDMKSMSVGPLETKRIMHKIKRPCRGKENGTQNCVSRHQTDLTIYQHSVSIKGKKTVYNSSTSKQTDTNELQRNARS